MKFREYEKIIEANEYAALQDILTKGGIVAIKGSVAVASSILTLEAEKKFF